jgi:small GTP-binding protein
MPLSRSVVCVGSAGCGKTCLLCRLVENLFYDNRQATIGVDRLQRSVTTDSGSELTLDFLDTAGLERFRSISTAYVRTGHVILLCYDESDRASFNELKSGWLETVQTLVPKTPRIIVATKSDLTRDVAVEEGMSLAERVEAPFVETSAKSGLGGDALIAAIVKIVCPEEVCDVDEGELKVAESSKQTCC